jgi:uncharacterized membrane protein YphA (DoxX/SURF4 family)
MRLRDSIALTLPSFLLRLVLGMTFIWAGTGKLIGTMQVSGDDAARLANLGVDLNPIPQVEPAPVESIPDEIIDPLPTDPPEGVSEDLQEQADDIVETIEDALDDSTSDQPAELPATDDPVTDEPEIESGSLSQSRSGSVAWTHVQHTSGDRIASDFPEAMECQRVYSIALMISKASDPGLTADSQPITPIMPSKLASRPWPKVLAWTAAITEIVAGAFLIVGLLTRISALSTFFVMLVAMWMTQFGPAALHTTDAILGFIPRADDLFSPAAYAQLFWQLALASMSLAVVFLGSGAIGIDRIFFPPHARDPYLHGDPKAEKKKGMDPASAQRTEFDRSPG